MYVIGLMSGTSADGVDAALCEVTGAPPQIKARIIGYASRPYPHELQARIHRAAALETSRIDEVCRLHFELGEWFSEAALAAVESAGMTVGQVDLIGSHGQTFWHQVEADGRVSATLQLTEAAVIAERTGITTISNFRPRDVIAGGQGAPLTAYADWLLLRHPTHWRAVQNIGGMGNVTFLPPLSDATSAALAFDTGAGNALIDGAVRLLTHDAQTYDHDGALASRGQIDEVWLEKLLSHPYYAQPLPKTTGRETFGAGMAAALVKEGHARGLDDAAIIATITALTAGSIAEAYRRFAPAPIHEVIIGGGGGRNPALMGLLRGLLAPTQVFTHEDMGMDSAYKEALVFALLAYETWHARPGNLPSATGARYPVVLGQVTPGANYVSLLRRTWCG